MFTGRSIAGTSNTLHIPWPMNDLADREKLSNIEHLEQFIQAGLKLIKVGSYTEAMRHFYKQELAKLFGYTIEPIVLSVSRIPSEEELPRLCDALATLATRVEEKSVLTIPQLVLVGITSLEEAERFNAALPQRLHQNQTLLAAEEWIHLLQHAKGGDQADSEIGVAKYLRDHQVPLTDEFLARYGRKETLEQDK